MKYLFCGVNYYVVVFEGFIKFLMCPRILSKLFVGGIQENTLSSIAKQFLFRIGTIYLQPSELIVFVLMKMHSELWNDYSSNFYVNWTQPYIMKFYTKTEISAHSSKNNKRKEFIYRSVLTSLGRSGDSHLRHSLREAGLFQINENIKRIKCHKKEQKHKDAFQQKNFIHYFEDM